jgi:hypothetical protein
MLQLVTFVALVAVVALVTFVALAKSISKVCPSTKLQSVREHVSHALTRHNYLRCLVLYLVYLITCKWVQLGLDRSHNW